MRNNRIVKFQDVFDFIFHSLLKRKRIKGVKCFSQLFFDRGINGYSADKSLSALRLPAVTLLTL